MNSDIKRAIKENSDSYSLKLFRHFQEGIPFSEIENKIVTAVRELDMPKDSMNLEDLGYIFKEHNLKTLPESLFHSGSVADIFINYHNIFMNHVIHSHDFFEIIYVCSGSIVDWVDGIEIPLSKGELCIHNPNAKHQILKMNPEEDFVINVLLPQNIFDRSFYSILMENKELDYFFNHFMISSGSSTNFMVFHNTSTKLDTIIELLIEEFLRGEKASRFIMESTLVVLFGELIRNYESNPFTKDLIFFISEHLSDISIERASKNFGYHKNYFPHVVKKKTGRTFLELVTEIRLQKSINLLLFSDLSLENISNKIGYKSTASFYYHFKKSYKMTPNQYRKKHLNLN